MTSPWPMVKFSKVAVVQNGFAFKSSEYTNRGWFLVRIANVQDGYLSNDSPKFVDLSKNQNLKRFELIEGDIVISLTGNVGRVAVVSADIMPAALNQRVAKFEVRDQNILDKNYFVSYLMSPDFKKFVVSLGKGAAQANVSTADIIEHEIPLPPLDEQKRIVAKLDDALGVVEELKANTAQSKTELDALWQSTLSQAFTAEWPMVKLEELCEILDSKRKPVTKSDRIPGPYPYYGATGIQDYVADFIFDETLVLIGEDGAKWGSGDKTAFKISGKTWVNNHAHVLRFDKSKISDDWVTYFFEVTDINPYISGVTVPKLNQGRLREIEIPLPPLDEQKRIVAKLDGIKSELDRQREILAQKESETERLRSSILAAAFSGEL